MKAILFIVLFFVGCEWITPLEESNRQWSWTCNTSLRVCTRYQSTRKSRASSSPYDTLEACRLICGQYGALWPKPTIFTEMSQLLIPFHPSSIQCNLVNATYAKLNYLTEVKNIFLSNLYKECGPKCISNTDTNISILVDTSYDDIILHPHTDESYKMEIVTKGDGPIYNIKITILAPTVYGIRHGFETLSQLVAQYNVRSDGDNTGQTGLVMVSAATIKDKPIFHHRGVMLDTGRNYLEIDAIKRQLDAMAASKMNVFHWHATDSQSFPLEMPRAPYLSQYGAYSKKLIYTKADIQNIQTYAKHRGIRIIMEIDAPSHAGNGWQWGQKTGLGNLAVCVNQQPWRSYCIQPPCGQLNPANKNVYDVLGELYKDLNDVLVSGEYFHMGGDEVFLPCWNATEEIISYMTKQGLGRTTQDFLELWGEFQSKALKSYNKAVGSDVTPVILWSSQLTEPENIEQFLANDRYIIQTWVPASSDLPTKLLQKGYRLIISTKDAWYLDHGFWGVTTYHNWRNVYSNKILRATGVLGGEVCSWGELVDKSGLDARVWPRAAAAAERLWSDPDDSTAQVEPRFYRHRERLVTRGIEAETLAPKWCLQNERECQ